MAQDSSPVGQSDRAQTVARAFADVRQGNLAAISDVQQWGVAAVPWVKPYLRDPDEVVRREAVSVLAVVGGESALPLLTQALTDASSEIRERAARALYERYEPASVAAEPAATKALISHLELGEPSAAALLLLGYCSGDSPQSALRKYLERGVDQPTKLFAASAPVAASLPAQVALAHLGDRAAMTALARTTEQATVAQLSFLLAVLNDIDAPRVLHAIKQALDDPRETSGGVPSGTQPRRRLCDDAVNAFVKRLTLHVAFPLSDAQRYSPQQIDQVRQQIDAFLPQ